MASYNNLLWIEGIKLSFWCWQVSENNSLFHLAHSHPQQPHGRRHILDWLHCLFLDGAEREPEMSLLLVEMPSAPILPLNLFKVSFRFTGLDLCLRPSLVEQYAMHYTEAGKLYKAAFKSIAKKQFLFSKDL